MNPTLASLVKRSQPLHGCHMKRRPVQLSANQPLHVKQKIVIVGDSHTRNSAAELQHSLGSDFSVTSFVKPGAGMGRMGRINKCRHKESYK